MENEKNKTYTDLATFFIKGKKGDTIFSEKNDNHITALASYYKRKVSTERIIALSAIKQNRVIYYLTKITHV